MNSEPFLFKQFKIEHHRSSMKVGTDGVLLGAWAELNGEGAILDIGTGSGVIALMAAQRNPKASIDAVELDRDSFIQASGNFCASKWAHQIKAYHINIRDFETDKRYDIILSNPPYYSNRKSSSSGVARNYARNSKFLPPDLLLKSVRRLLKPDGHFSMIYPNEEGGSFINMALDDDIFLQRVTRVRSTKGLKPERLLLQFGFRKEKLIENDLIIYQGPGGSREYTPDYISLTKDFYLWM